MLFRNGCVDGGRRSFRRVLCVKIPLIVIFALTASDVRPGEAIRALAEAGADVVPHSQGGYRAICRAMPLTKKNLKLLASCIELREVSFRECYRLRDSDLSLVATSKSLEHVNLDGTLIGNGGMPSLNVLSQLRSLSLRDTAITDKGLGALTALKNLEALDLNNTVVTNRGIANIAKFPKLKKLNLVHTQATG